MKKENRKEAQLRRAKERTAAERSKKLKKFGRPIAVIVILAIIVTAMMLSDKRAASKRADEQAAAVSTEESKAGETATSGESSSATDDTIASSSAEETAIPGLDTTEGLVAEMGDTVNIDYTGYKDGIAFNGGSTQGAGADLKLGSGTYIDGFEDQVAGHAVGETFDINVTFPENYGASDLAGADAVFTITLNGIYK